jgi:hypothetical protein
VRSKEERGILIPSEARDHSLLLTLTAHFLAVHPVQKVPRERHDLIQVGLQRPVPAVEQVKLRIRQISQIGSG